MRNPTYLTVSRDGVFHFRWPVPKVLHPRKKPTSLKLTLRTRDPSKALRLSRQLSYVGQALTMRGMVSGMRYDEMRATLKQHFAELLERKQQHIAEHGRLAALDISALESGLAFAQDAVAVRGDMLPGEADADLVAGFVQKYELALEPGTDAYASFRGEVQKAYRDYCSAVLDYDRSLEGYDFSSGLGAEQGRNASRETKSVSLCQIVEKFIAEEMRAGNWGKRTEDQKRQYLDLLQEILGADRDAGKISALDAQHVKEVLQKYPKNRNKLAEVKDLPIAKLMELTGIETLNVRTVNTYLQTYGSMFGWAKRNQYLSENPFEGITIRAKKGGDKESREAFSIAQVQLMVNEIETNELGMIKKDYQKWGPLIGLYTGARLNEVSQVQLADIKQVDDIWCFDFNDEGDGKRLKNAASKRLVSVHPKLLEYGLLAYVQALREQGASRLFPEFSYSAKEGYGRTLGRWFNDRFLVQLGIKSKGLVFHSFRHTMVTRLLQAGTDENVVKAIVGHTRQGVTQQHYFRQGYTLTQLQKALTLYRPEGEGEGL